MYMDVISRARELRRNQGNKKLILRGIEFLRTQFYSAYPIDLITFFLSKRRLRRRMNQEKNLEDIFDTIKTYSDSNHRYSGFGNYNRIFAQQNDESITKLLERVDNINPSTVMEIGTYEGGTAYLWSRYFHSTDTIICCDIYFRGRRKLYEFFGEFSDKDLICIKGKSQNDRVRKKVDDITPNDGIDFLFIDGDHSYEGVKSDFELYEPLVSEGGGGYIGFHDIYNENEGVPQFWNELKEDYDCSEIGSGGDTPEIGLVKIR